MIKKIFIAAALLLACNAVIAQEFKIEGTAALDYSDAKRGDTAGTTGAGFGAAQSEFTFSLKNGFDASHTLEAKAVIGVANPSGNWIACSTDWSDGKACTHELALTYTNTRFGRIKV